MKTYFDCIPCLIRQTLDAVRLVTPNEQIHEQLLREVLLATGRMDLNQSPPAMAQMVHRRIREVCGNPDPYRPAKDRFNRLALDLLPEFQRRLEASPDPWEGAVRLAIAGNVMDLGVKSGLNEREILDSIGGALTEPLHGNCAEFAASVAEAHSILYLTDNAGEIVFDRLLIERMPRGRVTVAVRGAPVINDATRDDAEAAGLPRFARVIDNGSDAPGTILADCSEVFQELFRRADVVVSKGQGNYETLRGSARPVHYLLRVKCPVLARDMGCSVGQMVLEHA